MSTNQNLTTVEWLSENYGEDNLVIVDCHWDPNAYLRAHIPGAIMRPGHPYIKSEDSEGKPSKQLPTADQFEDLMNRMGIDANSAVVCYDEWHNHFATRLWWLLRYYGHDKVSILNGGWQAWVEKGFSISVSTHNPGAGVGFEARARLDRLVGLDELQANFSNPEWQVVDVRSDGEYQGSENPGNLRSGHIPGALHLEWNKMLKPNERNVHHVRPKEEMEQLLSEAGVSKEKTTVVHCQSGIRATFMAFCLDLLQYPNVKVYDGSMSEWANMEETPLEK